MVEMRFLRLDGTAVEVEVQSAGVRYDGAPAIQVTAHDIGPRKEAEEALRESEERYRRLFEAESDAIIILDRDTGRFVDTNEAALRLYGYSREEFLRLRAADISSEPTQTRQAIAEGATIVPLRWHRKRDGTVFPVEISASNFEARGRKFHVGAIRDLTERKRAEAERQDFERRAQESQKLESLGVLAGGIAHDFNNILSGISGYASLARIAASRGANQPEYLEEIGRATQRAAELVRQILAFSRTGQAMVGRVQLRHVVDEAVRLLRATIPSTIAFETHLAQDLPAVSGDASQLHQIVMNLGTNSWHAMRERPGRLTIRLEECAVDEALAPTLPGVQPGPHVRLTVDDTGCGMSPETQQRVFEPFFTTKAPGEGTGLGLSVVHGIVRRHRGAIRLTSEVGRGTTFEIYLPAVASTPLDRREDAATAPVGQGERILFVDDEVPIMNIGRISLGQLGYEVVAESSAAEALARLEREPGTFHLVVTDQTMPEFTGLEFARRARALRPDLPVILATGNSVNLEPEQIQAAGICEVLEKPYTIGMLAAAVRRYLPPKPAA
jgi:PAS domain S-box-containing protein